MLLAGKSIDEVLSAAALQGEPALVRAVLAARKGDFQGALTAARTAGGAQGVQLALSILLAAGEVDAARQVVAQAAEDEGAAVLNAWMMHRDGKSKEAIEGLRKHLFNKGAGPVRLHHAGVFTLSRVSCGWRDSCAKRG